MLRMSNSGVMSIGCALRRSVSWLSRDPLRLAPLPAFFDDGHEPICTLFESASLVTPHGKYLDQRFIDFLAENFESIDDMHWRKFEGLSAEFFEREGARVEVGPGSNDDGVDLRVWWPDDDQEKPAAVLVQCKREKSAVDKVTLKALYADVLHERASSGLIVTTQRLSPGAETTRTARSYPIDAADRATLRIWIDKMRKNRTDI